MSEPAFVPFLPLAAALVVAASSKFVVPSAIEGTLMAIGVPSSGVRLAGMAVALSEGGMALLISIQGGLIASAAIWLFGFVLAVAGVIGLLRGGAIPCNCFGSSESMLGWRQVVSFPIWIVIGLLPLIGPLSELGSDAQRRLVNVAIVMAMAATYVVLRLMTVVYPITKARLYHATGLQQ